MRYEGFLGLWVFIRIVGLFFSLTGFAGVGYWDWDFFCMA